MPRLKFEEQKICYFAASILGAMCVANPEIVIDKLTGYLWDEEEAGDIKRVSQQVELSYPWVIHCKHCGALQPNHSKNCAYIITDKPLDDGQGEETVRRIKRGRTTKPIVEGLLYLLRLHVKSEANDVRFDIHKTIDSLVELNSQETNAERE